MPSAQQMAFFLPHTFSIKTNLSFFNSVFLSALSKTMKNKPLFFSYFFMVVLAVLYAFMAWRFTFYRLGIFLIPLVLLVSALITIVLKYFVSAWRSKGFLLFSNASSIIFLFLIGSIAFKEYKPTYVVHIPADFEGTVYLWPAKEMSDELFIDKNGMGYFNVPQEVKLKLLHGTKNVSDALNEYGRKSLVFPMFDSIHRETIDVVCFEIEKGRVYGRSPWNQPHAQCMDETEYLRLVADGIIDESKIKKEIYPR